MPRTISAPIGAFVSSTKARAKRRRRPRHAGHDRGGELSTIASIATEAKGDDEAIAFASLIDCDIWKDDEDDENMALVDCYGGTSNSGCSWALHAAGRDTNSTITTGNRFNVLDCTEPDHHLTSDATKPLPLSPRLNPPGTQDASPSVDKVNHPIGTPTEKQTNDKNSPAIDPQTQVENIRTLSVSPPQSDFTFKLATPTLIVTLPTPPEGYRVGRTKRRRRQSKANKASTNDHLLKPDNLHSTQMTAIADEQQADEVTSIPTGSPDNQASAKPITATDQGIFRIPSVSELTGKTWDIAPRTAPIGNPAPSDRSLDVKADTQADTDIEDVAESPLRQSYAAVTASRSHTSIDTTVHTAPPSESPVTVPGPLHTDPTQDWPSSLPTSTGPILPATKSRRSRFFPRQSPPATPAIRARRSSSTFRHPRFRERAKTIASSPAIVSKTGLPPHPPSQDPSLEVLVPSPVADDSSQQSLPSQAETQTTTKETPTKTPRFPRTTPWKWWRGDLSRLRNHSTTSPSPFPNEVTELELVKPKSLEKVMAKERSDFVPALGGEWEFVSLREGLSLRGGGDGEECEGSDGEWIWRCGEGCRCMRRGCSM